MKTKTLSDKRKERICCNTCDKGENIKHYLEEDVKEFIKELKEEMFDLIYNDGEYSDFAEMIDKLSGPKLI